MSGIDGVIADWWYNTTFHTSIDTTPYEIMYGQTPPIHIPYLPQGTSIAVLDRSFEAREVMLLQFKVNLEKAAQRMKSYADRH